jgi:uncharacterized protein (DUF2141 family)
MNFVKTSHIIYTSTSASLFVGAFMAALSYAAPAFAQVDNTSSDYEIILYDADTIARINAEKKANETPHTPNEVVQPSQVIDTNITASPITVSPVAPATAVLEAPRFPRDISAEIIDIIDGVPIMKDPQSCGKGLLEIGVTVENVASDKGSIVADLHNDIKEDFLVWDKVVLRVRADAKKGETTFCIPLTKPGEYSVAIYHDKNNNKKFDKNFLGIPSEHFGMSNNPKFGLKSPEYEQAAFTVPETGSDIKIRLVKSSDILGGQKR